MSGQRTSFTKQIQITLVGFLPMLLAFLLWAYQLRPLLRHGQHQVSFNAKQGFGPMSKTGQESESESTVRWTGFSWVAERSEICLCQNHNVRRESRDEHCRHPSFLCARGRSVRPLYPRLPIPETRKTSAAWTSWGRIQGDAGIS